MSGKWEIGAATSPNGLDFTKHADNPMIQLGAGGTWDDYYIYTPCVIHCEYKYYVYYSAFDGAVCRIGLATSLTGV